MVLGLTFVLLLHCEVDLVNAGLNVIPCQIVAALLSGCSLKTHQFIHVPGTRSILTTCVIDVPHPCSSLLTSERNYPPHYWDQWPGWTTASRGQLGLRHPSPGSSAPPMIASPRQRAAQDGTELTARQGDYFMCKTSNNTLAVSRSDGSGSN